MLYIALWGVKMLKLVLDGFKRNKLSMILYLSAIAFFLLEYLMFAFGVAAFLLDNTFMFACLIAVIGCLVQGENRKTYVAYIFAAIFCIMAFFNALNFVGNFIALVDGAKDAYTVCMFLSSICFSVMFISLTVFAFRQFIPNLITFIMLSVGLLGVLCELIASIILIGNFGFSLDLFAFVVPALFVFGTFFVIANEFSDGTKISVSRRTENADE